jgi:hypothetical protein
MRGRMLTLSLRRSCHLVATVAVLVAGCGSVAPEQTFEVREASTIAEQACTSSGAAICDRASACSPFWFSRIYTSFATCAAVFAERCVDRYRGQGAATEIADCSPTVRSLSCEELLDPVLATSFDPSVMLASCPVTPGLFAAGDRCLRDGDCTAGHCAWHGGCGTCTAPVAPLTFARTGEDCTSSSGCASQVCANGRCVAVAKLNEECFDRSCDVIAGLTCGSDHRCRPFGTVPLGEACVDFDYCETGATCLPRSPRTHDRTCQRDPMTAGVGADCALGCAHELTCVNGKCAASSSAHATSCVSQP